MVLLWKMESWLSPQNGYAFGGKSNCPCAKWDGRTRAPKGLNKDVQFYSLWPCSALCWPYAWIGPAHTLTGLHNDSSSNCLAQIYGPKEVILFAPEEKDNLYIGERYDWGSKLSSINIYNIDYEKFPKFKYAKGLYATLEPGDVLFIPRHWWHCVHALDVSISLSVFGLTPWQILVEGIPITVEHILHTLKLYKSSDCTCHPTNMK